MNSPRLTTFTGTSRRQMRRSSSVRHLPLLLLAAVPVVAQWAVDWHTTDGGGGTSSGGEFAVSGTIGQPDAGVVLAGGEFAVTGGFWALPVAVQTQGLPLLSIVLSAPGQITLSWAPATPGFVLQEASGPAAGWTGSPSGGTNPVTLPVSGTRRFYRLALDQ